MITVVWVKVTRLDHNYHVELFLLISNSPQVSGKHFFGGRKGLKELGTTLRRAMATSKYHASIEESRAFQQSTLRSDYLLTDTDVLQTRSIIKSEEEKLQMCNEEIRRVKLMLAGLEDRRNAIKGGIQEHHALFLERMYRISSCPIFAPYHSNTSCPYLHAHLASRLPTGVK
ncbi:hypothetical protein WG66_009405 [Moniliophthora roreri]|nr:hypothetical protein WG66_009405 [Moniliophthora roreri]